MSVEEIESEVARLSTADFARFSDWLKEYVATGPPHASLDENETVCRRRVVAEIDGFRAEMSRKYGVQPDSTPMIRAMRDHE